MKKINTILIKLKLAYNKNLEEVGSFKYLYIATVLKEVLKDYNRGGVVRI